MTCVSATDNDYVAVSVFMLDIFVSSHPFVFIRLIQLLRVLVISRKANSCTNKDELPPKLYEVTVPLASLLSQYKDFTRASGPGILGSHASWTFCLAERDGRAGGRDYS